MTYNAVFVFCQNFSRPIVARIVFLGLFIFVFWQFIAGVVSIIRLHDSANDLLVKPAVIEKTSNQRLSKKMLDTALFGKYVPVDLNDSDVKQSMLNLKVVGIMLADNARLSQVILHVASGGDLIFRVGDSVPGGAIIKRITADGIFVEHRGVLERLSFPKNELIFEKQSQPLMKD